jgi:hypothetical protein
VNGCHESIASARHRFDVIRAITQVIQGLAQHMNIECEIALLNEGIPPDGSHELIFLHKAAAALNEGQKYINGLSGEGHWLAIAEKQPLGGI